MHQALGLQLGHFFITMSKEPDWRSYVQADSPFVKGFSPKGACIVSTPHREKPFTKGESA